jgi:hypothetical protein
MEGRRRDKDAADQRARAARRGREGAVVTTDDVHAEAPAALPVSASASPQAAGACSTP